MLGADLTGATLTDACLSGANLEESILTGANLTNADLSNAMVGNANLDHAKLIGANLTQAGFCGSTLTGADFTNANVRGANFGLTTSTGFIKKQLYSTVSYQWRDLTGIYLNDNNLSEWDFSGQNLTSAFFCDSVLAGALFNGANLTGADFRGATGADFTCAILRNTILPDGSILGLHLNDGDELVVRDPPSGITVKESMSMALGSTLRVIFSASDTLWGSTMSFDDGVMPALGGTLELSVEAGTDPNTLVGKAFHLFNWPVGMDPTNQFGTIQMDDVLEWDVRDLYTSGDVTLTPEPATLSLLVLGGLAVLWRRRR